MNGSLHAWLDDIVVGVILLGSVGYALCALGPRALRGRILTGAAAALRLLPGRLRQGGLAQRLRAAADSKPQGACGGCQDCAPAPKSAEPAAEIRIPVSRIGKR
jgi:hypothetical protein